MLYQNEETNPLVVGTTNNSTPREVKNRKDYRFLGGLAAMLLMAMAYLANNSSSSGSAASLLRYGFEPNRLYVTISGGLPGGAQGSYKASKDTFNSEPIYDRDDGKFIAFMQPDKKWAMTHSVYRGQFVNSSGGRGHIALSYNRSPLFYKTRFPGQKENPDTTENKGQVTLFGEKYMAWGWGRGEFTASSDTYNGKPIWDEAGGQSFAVFHPDGYWHIERFPNGRSRLNGGQGVLNGSQSQNSLNKCDDFREATWDGQTVVIIGQIPQNLGGRFRPTKNTFNGKPIWVRDDNRLLAFQDADGKWAFSGYQYLSAFVSKANGGMGAVLKATNESESFNDARFPGQREMPR